MVIHLHTDWFFQPHQDQGKWENRQHAAHTDQPEQRSTIPINRKTAPGEKVQNGWRKSVSNSVVKYHFYMNMDKNVSAPNLAEKGLSQIYGSWSNSHFVQILLVRAVSPTVHIFMRLQGSITNTGGSEKGIKILDFYFSLNYFSDENCFSWVLHKMKGKQPSGKIDFKLNFGIWIFCLLS